VALARLLRQSANVVMLDEPTNDLDVGTLGALESMLVETGATALVVTHDRWFLDRVATGILAFEGDGRVIRYPGNFSDYRRLRAEAERQRADAVPVDVPVRERAATARAPKKKLSFAEERELAELPDRIDQKQARLDELHRLLADPKTYASGADQVAQLKAELAEIEPDLERLMARWEALETKKQPS
jgi:ATP-binding cassette subfamily F protein uup